MKSIKQISAILLMAFIPAAILVTGCGAEEVVNNDLPPKEVSEEEDGADWRTTRFFVYLDQKTPDGVVKLLAGVYEADGCVIVAPDDFSYKPYPDLVLVDGVHDFDTVQDNMYMADFNGDGYDDLSIDDLIDGARVSEVFIFNNFDNYFEYSDEYSTVRANLQSVSCEALKGAWYVDGDLDAGYLVIDEEGNVVSYSYEDTVNYEGIVVLEEYENPDGIMEQWYNIYDNEGSFVFGFPVPEEEEFGEFYTGQDGDIHFMRTDCCGMDGWRDFYLSAVEKWDKDHSNDTIYGYKLINLDDNPIPELVLMGGADWCELEIHAVRDGEEKVIYKAKNLGVDGNGLQFFERSEMLIEGKWNGGIGQYLVKDPFDAEPDTVYIELKEVTAGGLSETESTDIMYIQETGDAYTAHYDDVAYDFSSLPEKANIEETYGIKDLGATVRIDGEDGIMDYAAITEYLNY